MLSDQKAAARRGPAVKPRMAVLAAMALAMLTLLNGKAFAVTYTASGTFDDGSTWSATAVFAESAMADGEVFLNEMDSFTVITQAAGPYFVAATYDLTDANFLTDGFAFDGTTAGASVIDSATSLADDPVFGGFYYDGFDSGTSQNVALSVSEIVEFSSAEPDPRTGAAPVWVYVHESVVVPEPVTASLIPLAIAPLLVRRRRGG